MQEKTLEQCKLEIKATNVWPNWLEECDLNNNIISQSGNTTDYFFKTISPSVLKNSAFSRLTLLAVKKALNPNKLL